ncbi:MAG: PilX N-terminal domain-containing pilus assembly protein [Pseudomonadota bacterium]
MATQSNMQNQRSQLQQARAQRGVVLIMALIMLVIISLLTAVTVRNATSSEGISANARQTQLATQAAETALRYCEQGVIEVLSASTSTYVFSVVAPPSATTVTISSTHFQAAVTTTPTSMITANWDTNSGTANTILVLPSSSVNRAGITTTFSRPPECMIERLSPSTSTTHSKNFTITARGFGPEVQAANAARSRPVGSEVWMQSTLELR